MLTVIQSHWSKPARWQYQNKSLGQLLLMYGLSAHTMRKYLKARCLMATDSAFASILMDLPQVYDGVSTDLDAIDGIDTRLWAYTKFYIFRRYGAIPHMLQIDTDVFFWDEMTIGSHVDLVVQSVEDYGYFPHTYEDGVKFVQSALNQTGVEIPYWRDDVRFAYNCGVVGFRDGDLAKEYAENAMALCEAVEPYLNIYLDNVPKDRRKGGIMPILEQYYLACFAQAKNLHVSHVAARKLADGSIEAYHPKDYFHAMGSKKDPEVRRRIAKKAEEEIPEFYKAVMASAYSAF